MQVFRGLDARPETLAGRLPSALTIGNFDGVHRGHRALLARLVAVARERALVPTVLTFEPHPREYFAPEAAPARLSSLREKLVLLAECGVERVHVCRFDARMAACTAEEFAQRIVARQLRARHVLIGDDFRFGQGRRGDLAFLTDHGRRDGFSVEAMHTVQEDGERVSSSAVRAALAAGDSERAEALLGRPFVISGRIVHGDKIGRTLGFPTANVALKRKVLPLSGVFAVTVVGAGETALHGAASLGVRPTLAHGLKPTLEVHLLDFDQDIYGAHVTVNFLHKLRDEAKYDSLESLTAQIRRDVDAVRAYFESNPHHG
jgi:riboflavin kinase/FMN adenylyltransferase